jgi:hypothetical protein
MVVVVLVVVVLVVVMVVVVVVVVVKGKAIPLQAWTDPEGSRSLRLPYFETVGT